MENAFDVVRNAVNQAKETNDACDLFANRMVDLIDGRLRHVSAYRLKRLKRALQDFNAHTGEWKS